MSNGVQEHVRGKLPMPPVGTKLAAVHKKNSYEAEIVLENDRKMVLFNGVKYKTLTMAARQISQGIGSGKIWKFTIEDPKLKEEYETECRSVSENNVPKIKDYVPAKLTIPPIGTKLIAKYKGKTYFAEVVTAEDGKAKICADGKLYKNLTSAARSTISPQINSGKIWKVETNEETTHENQPNQVSD